MGRTESFTTIAAEQFERLLKEALPVEESVIKVRHVNRLFPTLYAD
jgi:hypothetical protein